MSEHKVFIANTVFPRFSSTPSKYRSDRSGRIAGLIEESGADCAALSECGYGQAQALSKRLDWKYDRTQGTASPGNAGEGMNCGFYRPSTWDQPSGRVSDYNLPSAGQWQRTLLVQRLEEAHDRTAFFGLTVGHSTLGDAGGLAYVKAMISKIGDRRVLVGMDLKRTQDTDDLALLKKKGFKVHGRTSRTPMVCLAKGKLQVTDVKYVSDSRAFDHDALVVTFEIPNSKDQA